MHLQKNIYRFSIFLCFVVLGNTTFSQSNKIPGDWAAQKQSQTCWAATLSNVTRPAWKRKFLPENFFTNGRNSPIETNNFKNYKIGQYFKYRSVGDSYVLSFNAINKYLSYKFPRPLINSFSYLNYNEGHFVNFIGTITGNIKEPYHDKWLIVFDPKPDNIGSIYYKNYNTYRLSNETGIDLQQTYYNIISKKLKYPKKIDLNLQTIFSRDNFNGICLDTLSINQNITRVIQNQPFEKIYNENQVFNNNIIPILNVLEIIEGDRLVPTSFTTVRAKSESEIIFTKVDNKYYGGFTIQHINNNCKLIDRIENISRYDSVFQAQLLDPSAYFLELNNAYKILVIQEGSKYVDMDGLFGIKQLTYSKTAFLKLYKNINKTPVRLINEHIRETGFEIEREIRKGNQINALNRVNIKKLQFEVKSKTTKINKFKIFELR